MKLLINYKTHPSFSLTPWILMKHAGIDFVEVRALPAYHSYVPLAGDTSVLTPVLMDSERVLWRSLEICKYIAEHSATALLWPIDSTSCMRAINLCEELANGFNQIKYVCPGYIHGKDSTPMAASTTVIL